MRDGISKLVVSPEISIKAALKSIDEGGLGILFVCDGEGRLLGSLTDGDIRRRFLKTGTLQEEVRHCINRNPVSVVKDNYDIEEIKRIMLEKLIEVIPVLDEGGRIVDILLWSDILKEPNNRFEKIDLPVVILAGGKGERLGPFTKILPKPLMPFGEKPIIEVIMDRFNQHGISHFYVSLNYKGKMIEAYLGGITNNYKIDYIWEKEFLGTAASIRLIEDDLGDNFIVSNCDILVTANYADMLRFHKDNKNILTVAGSIQYYKLPYGIIHFEQEGKIRRIQEKPEYDLMVNTGVYILSSRVIELIPNNRHFDMTDLIDALLGRNANVGVYPISQNSYLDIGQMEDYRKVVEKLDIL